MSQKVIADDGINIMVIVIMKVLNHFCYKIDTLQEKVINSLGQILLNCHSKTQH